MRRRGWLALCAIALLAGCSVLSIAYDNADRIALAYADDLFDLDHAQGKRFRERVRARMVQHRNDELPRYTGYLRQLRGMVGGKPSADEVDAVLLASRELIELGIRRSLPLMADTLVELTPQQVEHLAEEIADANEDYAEELAEDTPAERQHEREKELIKEIERWTGTLAEPQRGRLRALAAAVPDGSHTWFEHRQLRQRGLLALLRARAARDAYFAYVEEWWLGDRHLDPALLQQLARNRRLTAEALTDLVATLTPKQRARVVARLDDLIEDLDGLHAAGAAQGGA
jgi:hypothetical protein